MQKNKGVQADLSSLWKRIKSGICGSAKVQIVCGCYRILHYVRGTDTTCILSSDRQRSEYVENYKLQIQKTKDVEGTRGNIYDRNGKLLAYNELAYSVTIEDNGDYDSKEQKNKELNKVIRTVIDMVESNGDTVINDFGIILNKDNQYMFTAESDTQRLRFIADVYGKATIDKLKGGAEKSDAG